MITTELFNWNSCNQLTTDSVFMGKVFYLWSGRNAWNWSWSSRYPGIRAFHLTLGAAKDEIESRRVQGSTWTIQELPAITFISEKICLVICEINTENPFSDHQDTQFSSITLESINNAFIQTRPNSIQKFVTSDKILPAHLPFCRFKSYSNGGKYHLGWSPKDSSMELKSLHSIIGTISQLAQRRK